MEKVTIADQIIDKLTKSYGMSRAQLALSLGKQREEIRKPLNKLIEQGKVIRTTDNNGIEHLTIGEVRDGFEEERRVLGAEVVAQEMVLNKLLDARPIVGEAATKVILPPTINVEDTTPSYSEGFTQGFAEGVAKSQREAYAAGRKSAFDQIRNLLGGME